MGSSVMMPTPDSTAIYMYDLVFRQGVVSEE